MQRFRASAERKRLSARLIGAGTKVPAYPIKAKVGLASFDYAQDRLRTCALPI